MSTSTAPNAAPLLNWEKADKQLKSVRKKRNPLMIVAVLAIVVLGVSGIWRATHQAAPAEWVKVVAVSKDTPPGTRLSFTSLRYIEFPKKFMQRDMALSLSDVAGNVTRTFIPQGEPIRAAMVFVGRHNLSKVLETQERAITLQLADDALVDHAIEPDDLVDVLVVSTKDGAKYTKTICQDARVLITASKEQASAKHGGASGTNKITLAVSPELAERVAEAAEVGKIRLVLRNKLGRTEQHLFGADEDDLLPGSALQKQAQVMTSPPAPASAQTSVNFAAPLPPPPVPEALKDIAAPPQGPIEWMVDVFNGNKKESIAVPSN
jgi:Flp pilus assembly protein CpaB